MREGLFVDLWKNFKFGLQTVVGAAALFLFVLSTGIHVCTWVYPAIARYTNPLMWTHAAVLAACGAYAFLADKTGTTRNRIATENLPTWAQVVSTALFAYLFLSIAFLFASGVFGNVHTHDALDSAGQTIPLEKTSQWYSYDDVCGLRFFSIFWMLFSFHLATASFYCNFTTRFGRYDAVVKRI